MPEIFIPFGEFDPEGGDVGEGLVRADNALPLHGGHRPLRQPQQQAALAGDGPVTGAFVHIFQAEKTVQEAGTVSDLLTSESLVTNTGSQADLYLAADEEEPDDTDFIVFGGAPLDVGYGFGFAPVEDPGVDTGHVIRYRYRIQGGAGAWSIDALFGDGSVGTLEYQFDSPSGTGDTGWVAREVALDTAQVELLSNYSLLKCVFNFTVAGSAQFGRPVADASLDGWTNQAASVTNVFQSIDEASASDADYAQSPVLQLGGARRKYRVDLTDLVDPFVVDASLGSYTIRYRYKTTNAGVNVKVSLGHGAPGTVIASQEHAAVTAGSFIAGSLVVDTEMFALVAQGIYDDLWMEFEAHWPTEGSSVATQNAVPTSDESTVTWTPSSGATVWEAIDADDGVTVTSPDPILDINEFFIVGTPATDPGLDTAHTITIKAARVGSSGTARFRVELLEGSTVRFSDNFTRTSASLTDEVIPVHPSFVAAIGNYANLRLKVYDQGTSADARCKVSFAKLSTPEPRRVQISWAEFETPSTAQGQISWARLEVPAVVTTYEGDKPTLYAGTTINLYEVGTAGFTEISKVADGYGAGDTPSAWRFCQDGPHTIATNGSDPVQWREDNAGDFKDLISAPSPAPAARFVAPWRERLLLGGVSLTAHAVDEIWISSASDHTDFAPSATTGAGFEPIRSRPGQLMGIIGGQEGVLFKRNDLFRMIYTGGNTLFRIEDLPGGQVGTPYPGSIVEGGDGYFYFHDGHTFRRGTVAGLDVNWTPKVDRMLTDFENLDESIAQVAPGDPAREDQVMVGAYCRATGLFVWTYQSKLDEPWRHSRGVVYNPKEDRWTPLAGDFDLSYLVSVPNTITADTKLMKSVYGFTWNGTDAAWFKWAGDTLEVVFDTKLRRLPAATDAERDATTGRFAEPSQERMNVVTDVRPILSFPRGGSPTLPPMTVEVTGYRDADRTNDTLIVETATSANRNDRGLYNFGRGVHGFYHSFKFTLGEIAANAVYNVTGYFVRYLTAGGR